MAAVGSAFLTTSRSQLSRGGSDTEPTVIWLRGEHDVSSTSALSLTIAQAIAHDDGCLVIDLSDVEFMSWATVDVLIRARQFLRLRGRSLMLRSPSMCVRRVFEICRVSDLLDLEPAEATAATATGALATWVAVRPTRRVDGGAEQRETSVGLAAP